MGLVTSAYHSVSAGLWSNNAITTFVGGLDGIINTVTLTGLTPSTILRHGTDGVILDNASGNFSILHIIVPPANGFLAALPPTAGTPIPDLTTPSYTGTWSVKSNGGNTKLKSN